MALQALQPHAQNKVVLGWFIISSFFVLWDAGYIFARPHSFPGGFLYPIWAPYEKYGTVDLVYSRQAYESRLGFTAAQGFLNIIETALNFAYVYIMLKDKRPSLVALAPLIGLIAVVMTESKTALYWLQDYLGGWTYTGHNDLFDFVFLFVIPNGFWLVMPAYVAYVLGVEIGQTLQYVVGAGPMPFQGPPATGVGELEGASSSATSRGRSRSRARKFTEASGAEESSSAAAATQVRRRSTKKSKAAAAAAAAAADEAGVEDAAPKKTPRRRKSTRQLKDG